MARTQICAHVKDPTSICCKRVGLTASDMETQKHCTQGVKKSREKQLKFLCTALDQQSYFCFQSPYDFDKVNIEVPVSVCVFVPHKRSLGNYSHHQQT